MCLLWPSFPPLFRTLTCFFLPISLKKTLKVDNTHRTIQFLRILAFLPFRFCKKFSYVVFGLLWTPLLVHIARPRSLVSNQIYQNIPFINQTKFKFSLILQHLFHSVVSSGSDRLHKFVKRLYLFPWKQVDITVYGEPGDPGARGDPGDPGYNGTPGKRGQIGARVSQVNFSTVICKFNDVNL